jgi:cyclic 2,3-diphosphoglycerate synthetase
MARVVALIDGEHYPPVVRTALQDLGHVHEVVAACFVGGTEKVDAAVADYGVPLTAGPDAASALAASIERYVPDLVVDLSDEPVVTSADRFRLAGIALASGLSYLGADFQFDPVAIEAETATPTLAIVGTGKRVGKTAVSAHVARLLAAGGVTPVVIAMGRGGPAEPEIVRGDQVELTTEDLLRLAHEGIHAASDSYEDAAMSRVATVGCRRCGGGMAGSVFFSNVPEGAALADGLGASILLLEGSGAAVPPVVADATVLVVGAARGLGYVTDYFGPLRLAGADMVVVAGAEPSLVDMTEVASIVEAVRAQRPDVPVSVVTFRPRPLTSVREKRVFFATTAPAALLPTMREHLEREHGCTVVGMSANLSNRPRLRDDLDAAEGGFDVLLTELKAAAIDVVAEAGERSGIPTVLCDNVPVTVSGDDLDESVRALAEVAVARGTERRGHAG